MTGNDTLTQAVLAIVRKRIVLNFGGAVPRRWTAFRLGGQYREATQMKVGLNMFIWTANSYQSSLSLLPVVKAGGFDSFEVPIRCPREFAARDIRRGGEEPPSYSFPPRGIGENDPGVYLLEGGGKCGDPGRNGRFLL